MIRASAMRAWLDDQTSADVVLNDATAYEDMPDMPDAVVVLALHGGRGLRFEGAYDNLEFQVKVRGEQGDYDSAEDLAFEVDKILLSASMPTIGGTPVLAFYRVGSPPTPLQTLDDGGRTVFVCNYGIDGGSHL